MELLIFPLFCFFNLILYIVAVIKRNLFLGITSGIIFIILGTFLVSEGLTITHTGAYGFAFNDTASSSGIATSAQTVKDTFSDFMGFALWILGLGSITLSVVYAAKGSKEPE